MNLKGLLVIALLCTISLLRAQAPIIVCSTDGIISEVNLPNTCDKTEIVEVGISLSDITLHPNGKMYGTRFSQGTLVEVDLTQDNQFTTIIDFDDDFEDVNPVGMTASSNGKIYITEGGESDTRLFEVDVTTNTAIVKGILANGSAGDLSWSNGELYNASGDNQLVKVDIESPENSVVIGPFNTGSDETIFSLVTAYINCDSSITYGISNQTNQYYIIDLSDAGLTTLCAGDGARIFGATSTDEFSASDTCTISIDLDLDNSSTATGADFNSTFGCESAVAAIADTDVTINAVTSIDSIVIVLTNGILDGASEILTTGNIANITSNDNATTIVATNNGAASVIDFEGFLQGVLYVNSATPPSNGDRQIEVTVYSNGESSNTAVATVTISGNADAGTDGTLSLCTDDATVNLVNSLGGTPQNGGTWSPPLNSGSNIFDPSEDATGVYTYTVGDACASDSATVTVTLNTPPNAGSNGSVTLCSTDPAIDLTSSLGDAFDNNGTWSPALTSGTGVFDPAEDNAGSYVYTVAGQGNCDDASATVTVTVNICDDISLDLDDDNSSGATGADFNTTLECETFSAPITDIDIAISSDEIIDSVVVQITSGIHDVNNEVLQSNISNNIDVVNTSTTIIGTNNGSATIADFETFLSSLSYLNSSDPITDGIRLVTVTIYSNNLSASATTTIDIQDISVNAGTDNSIVISDGNTVDLFGLLGSDADFNGTWSPPLASGTGLFDPNIDTEGEYTYIVANDCDEDSATITVEIETPSDCRLETLFIPTGFTPNNDGQNDVYYINLLGSYDKLDFRIYNRWGEIVFETNDILIGWDGQFNGQLQTTDVFGYFLQIECDEEIIQRKGNITVVR